MKPVPAPGPWEEPAQAEAYLALCRDNRLYADASSALVKALGLGAGERVADLGCGHGETTSAALERVRPGGRVVGVDPAPRMISAAQARFAGRRGVRFSVGDARALKALGPFDAVLCNAAIWLDPDVPGALRAIRASLGPGGRLGLGLPAEYLGHAEHLTRPLALEVGRALADIRARWPPTAPPDPGFRPELLSEAAFAAAGFSRVRRAFVDIDQTLGQRVVWLSLPVVRRGVCSLDAERFRAELRARLPHPPETALGLVWAVVEAS